LNVINVTGNINLGAGQSLTLSGTASDIFVINVSGTLSRSGNAKLLVSGVPLQHVIYNFISSSGTINTGIGDVMNGIFLAPNYSMTLDGIWNGEIISGKTIQLLSGVRINGPSPVREPGTFLLLGTALTSLGYGAGSGCSVARPGTFAGSNHGARPLARRGKPPRGRDGVDRRPTPCCRRRCHWPARRSSPENRLTALRLSGTG
jgi:hypothetical protein